jgi:hypothetical protein
MSACDHSKCPSVQILSMRAYGARPSNVKDEPREGLARLLALQEA